MRDNKIIEILVLLALSSISSISAQYCEDTAANYTSYSFDSDVRSTDELCKCMQANLEKKGLLKGKEFYCVESRDLVTIRYANAKDDGRSECAACVPGCKKVITTNPKDSEKICEILRNDAKKLNNETGIRRSKRRARFSCSLVVEVGWFSIGIHVGCK